MKTEFETLQLSRPQAHVLLVTLNRPGLLNALNTRMGQDLVELFEALALDAEDLRCVVLTGAEKAFCAGGDLKQRDGMSSAEWTAQHLVFERMARALLDCPLPLIAAVNGAAFGGGCEIACCCDFIYASEQAKFALPEAKLGIMPGAGGTQTLSRAVGERRAKELIMTGRPFGAADAERWGLVNAAVPPDALMSASLAAAGAVAANAPLSTRQIKQSITRGSRMSLGDALTFEIEAYNRLVPTADRLEGVRAFNEKRPPAFEGR